MCSGLNDNMIGDRNADRVGCVGRVELGHCDCVQHRHGAACAVGELHEEHKMSRQPPPCPGSTPGEAARDRARLIQAAAVSAC